MLMFAVLAISSPPCTPYYIHCTQEPKTADLSGIYCCDIFRHKTNYELAYTIVEKDGETVVVNLAGTRENFYEELKPRY